MNENLRSKCCDAKVKTDPGDEGTNFFVCTECDKACDVKLADPVDRGD